MTAPLLALRGLTVTARGVPLTRGIDLDIFPGETLGIIGESGSGKTVTCLSLLRLLPGALQARSETMRFKDTELSTLSGPALRELRGRAIAMIFQDPVGAFNPAKRIGWHLRAVHARRGPGGGPGGGDGDGDWRAASLARLADVGIADPAGVLARYPHQLSGGMLQRALIAATLMLEPELIIADEPTANLDNIVAQQILDLFEALQARLSSAFVFITHDIAVAGRFCHRIAVMYAGQLVETGPAASVLAAPRHPYTAGLIATARALADGRDQLAEIPGQIPAPDALPPGCVFAPRCDRAGADCAAPQLLRTRPGGRADACVRNDALG